MQHLGTILTPTSTRSIKEGLFPAAARQDAGMSADGGSLTLPAVLQVAA
jgi:hypothetical protein